MANLKNILQEALNKNSDLDYALENISKAQQNILKNYSNPVFNTQDQEKLLDQYSLLENLGKFIYRRKALISNNINVNDDNSILEGSINNTKYIWHSENGENTCDACKSLDGTTYNLEDEVPERPHPNCKCTVEIIEDDKKNSCNCINEIQSILEQVDEYETELISDINEIEQLTDDIETDFDNYKELNELANSLNKKVNCGVITGFAVDLNNDKELDGIFYDIIKYSPPAREAYEKFQENKKLMEERAENHIDKYYHAKANCESSEISNLHAQAALAFSILKEVKDYLNKVFVLHKDAKVIFKDCMEDLHADIYGLIKGYEEGQCSEKVLEIENYYKRK